MNRLDDAEVRLYTALAGVFDEPFQVEEDQPGLRPLFGVVEADVQRARADQVLEVAAGPLGEQHEGMAGAQLGRQGVALDQRLAAAAADEEGLGQGAELAE